MIVHIWKYPLLKSIEQQLIDSWKEGKRQWLVRDASSGDWITIVYVNEEGVINNRRIDIVPENKSLFAEEFLKQVNPYKLNDKNLLLPTGDNVKHASSKEINILDILKKKQNTEKEEQTLNNIHKSNSPSRKCIIM